ncbi:MAG: putative DNA binding domain-containing protein [Nitrospirae bacterium]|nr:putative DNA binding domain-containing protein [Nitrospirota bacterium]
MTKVESQNIEFKSQWSDDALKTVCAFANTDGGTIFIGLDDQGRSVVLKDTKKLLEDIPNKIRDILGIVVDVKIVPKAGKPVIKVAVKKYTAPISYRGAFYIRSGSTTSELKSAELSRFLLSRAGTSWDNIVEPKAAFDDISPKAVRHFQQLARKRFPFIATEKSIRPVLQKLNLVEKGKLKRAAILLFGKDPRKYFTPAFIQIGRFVSESEVISTDVIEGNLFEQVERPSRSSG